tara:strand:+ start:940 stop:1362 length:423 start_codon:yes stop_codon:yes gene_type:complete
MSELIEVAREIADAIQIGDVEEAVKLLDGNDALIHFTEFGGTWLHLACCEGNAEMAKWLIDHGISVNVSDEFYGTPIDQAAMYGHLELVRFLVSANASLDTSDHTANPLYSAIHNGHQHVVEYLITTDLDRHTTYRTPTG